MLQIKYLLAQFELLSVFIPICTSYHVMTTKPLIVTDIDSVAIFAGSLPGWPTFSLCWWANIILDGFVII